MRLLRLAIEAERWDLAAHTIVLAAVRAVRAAGSAAGEKGEKADAARRKRKEKDPGEAPAKG